MPEWPRPVERGIRRAKHVNGSNAQSLRKDTNASSFLQAKAPHQAYEMNSHGKGWCAQKRRTKRTLSRIQFASTIEGERHFSAKAKNERNLWKALKAKRG